MLMENLIEHSGAHAANQDLPLSRHLPPPPARLQLLRVPIVLPITYVIKTVHPDPCHYQKVATIARRTCPPAGGSQEADEERNSRENALNAWHILPLALSWPKDLFLFWLVIVASAINNTHATHSHIHAGSGSSIQKEWAYMTYG